MRALGLILGRAGSKGVPGKNVALVAGRECARWTIDDALGAKSLSRIVLSTDSNELLRIGLDMGVDVVARPPELATDRATVDDAARHALSTLADKSIDAVVILYANAPVRPPGLIDRVVELLASSGADSAQSYAPVGKHHPWWTARIDPASAQVGPWEGRILNNGVFRRQDLPPAYLPDGGALAVTRRALFLEIPGVPPGPHAFFGADRRAVINDEGAVVDIDSPIDLLVADAILRERAAHAAGAFKV